MENIVQNLVTFIESPIRPDGTNTLTIKPQRWKGCREAIRQCRSFWDLIEYHRCNGWEEVRPEEVGALTDAEIISQDSSRDDDGKLLSVGRVYAFMDYQTVDPVATLASGKAITLVGC